MTKIREWRIVKTMAATTITSGQIVIFFVISIWVLVWKGIALWKAAGKKDKPWFIALLIFNTLGILEMLYIFVFSKRVKEIKSKE